MAEVNSDLMVHDKKGKIYTVRHDAVNAMLLNDGSDCKSIAGAVIRVTCELSKSESLGCVVTVYLENTVC